MPTMEATMHQTRQLPKMEVEAVLKHIQDSRSPIVMACSQRVSVGDALISEGFKFRVVREVNRSENAQWCRRAGFAVEWAPAYYEVTIEK